MKKLYLIFSLFCCLPLIISAQNTGVSNVQVKGQLLDSLSRESVPYVTLKIMDKTNPKHVIKALATDDNGKFNFSMNKKGEFILLAEYIGKNSLSKELEIGNSKVLDLGVLLMSDNSTALSEVVVSAQKPLVKVDLDKIIYSMADDPEAKTNDILEMLKKVPLVTVDGEDNIKLKGSSNFKIYMNGKPSPMMDKNPKDILKSMPASSIQNIEVITDPGAKYDAEGVTGIINIITQKNTSMGGYTATVSGRGDSQGGFGTGVYTQMKYGKIGFNGNLNYYHYESPRSNLFSLTKQYNEFKNHLVYQNGTHKNKGDNIYAYGELSIEIDTLNLISASISKYGGKSKNKPEATSWAENDKGDLTYKYAGWSDNSNTYGGLNFNVDYQRTFAGKKDRLFTASYRFNSSPNDSEASLETKLIDGVVPSYITIGKTRQYSDADTKEHTFQADFTTPFAKKHNVEAGLKYINRANNSTSANEFLDASGNWVLDPNPKVDHLNNKFKHNNDIFSAYTGYSLKSKKWGVKAGLRMEATKLHAKYILAPERNFKKDYENLVPSATLTYQISQAQNIRLGYNMRIMRPGIWQLNPYVNTSNPEYIRHGNPELEPVKSHNINMNYGYFNPKININMNLSYNFHNDGIEEIMNVVDADAITGKTKILETTYDNIGQNKHFNLSSYINWSPSNKFRIYANLGGGYTDIKANNNTGLKNSGFTGNMYGGVQYNLPFKMWISANTGYFSSDISLQGENSSFFFHSFSIRKSFLKDRLNTSIYASNPFKKSFEYTSRKETKLFYTEHRFGNTIQRFGINISYRFGELKAQIKKVRRGITNDDVAAPSSGGQGQGGGQGGAQN